MYEPQMELSLPFLPASEGNRRFNDSLFRNGDRSRETEMKNIWTPRGKRKDAGKKRDKDKRRERERRMIFEGLEAVLIELNVQKLRGEF